MTTAHLPTDADFRAAAMARATVAGNLGDLLFLARLFDGVRATPRKSTKKGA